MKKGAIVTVLLILSIILLETFSSSAGESFCDTREIEQRLRKKSQVQEMDQAEQVFTETYDTPEELKNQAAGRDYSLLNQYLKEHADSKLYECYSGAFINQKNDLVIKISDQMDACRKELRAIPFETEIIIEKGQGSFFQYDAIITVINQRISEMNRAVLEGYANEKECEIMAFYPCADHDIINNQITVRLAAEGHEEQKKALELFREMTGDYEVVSFQFCEKEDVFLKTKEK